MKRYLLGLVVLLPAICHGYLFESKDKHGNPIMTCASEANCTTMPNPKDLSGLELRQAVNGKRSLLFYSPDHTFTCMIFDVPFHRPIRVVRGQMPEVVDITSLSTIRLECWREDNSMVYIFYVPKKEYLVHIVR